MEFISHRDRYEPVAREWRYAMHFFWSKRGPCVRVYLATTHRFQDRQPVSLFALALQTVIHLDKSAVGALFASGDTWPGIASRTQE